jgi:uncharacterized DUF497 family protein
LLSHYDVTIFISELHSEWDEKKTAASVKKRGVSFDKAKPAFYDERARLIADPEHSEDEDRFVPLGLSSALRRLVVCHCWGGDGSLIRIISSRETTAKKMELCM